jgi:hypothetical protein
MNETQALNNVVRVGTVSSVDVDARTARVIFADKADLISGPLKIIQNQPLITVEKWVEEVGEEVKWDNETEYHSVDRGLGLGESYCKGELAEVRQYEGGAYETYMTHKPDVIKNEKVIKYEKRETISEGSPIVCDGGHEGGTCSVSACPIHGIIEYKKNRQTVTVYPWLPYIGQFVLCVYLPSGESDGFVLGGL